MNYQDIYWNLFTQSGDLEAYMQYRNIRPSAMRREAGGRSRRQDGPPEGPPNRPA